VSGTGEERAGLWVFFLGIIIVSGTGGGARVEAVQGAAEPRKWQQPVNGW